MRWPRCRSTTSSMPTPLSGPGPISRCGYGSPNTHPEFLARLLSSPTREGILPGDRRQFKAVGVAGAFAWLDGADRVEPEHLEVLQHVLWDSPEEQPEKVAQVIARIANPTGMRLNQLLECQQVLSSTDIRNIAQAS